jgi:chemotaxis regulatin CheY-phosphate phosphatase CheZ
MTKRIVQSWVSFPEGKAMKAIATCYFDQGHRGRALENEFKKLVPVWRSYFKRPINDSAISQRADKARRYASEAPEHDPRLWRAVKNAVRAGKPLGKRALRQLATEE